MQEHEIRPHKITKPIQLLSAWLVGLILINGSFIAGAISLSAENYLQSVLVIASILNVPIFIISIFLLQTKYRPEMQEDIFYSRYLDQKTNKIVEYNRLDVFEAKLDAIEKKMPKSTKQLSSSKRLRILINDHLPKFSEIRQFLKENNFQTEGVFGKVNGTARPDRWTIGISNAVDLDAIKPLLKKMPELGIDFFSIFDPWEEPSNADIFIGAYGNVDGEINEYLLRSIDSWDFIDLIHFSGKQGKSD